MHNFSYWALLVVTLSLATSFKPVISLLAIQQQKVYYLCGIFPNMYYSLNSCYYTERYCPYGSHKTNQRCTNGRQCNKIYSTHADCIQGYCCRYGIDEHVDAPPNMSGGLFFNYNLIFGQCPNGQISQVRCSAQGQCDQDQICLNGLCCTRTEFDYRYPCGGITALGNCTNKNCTGGLSCTASGFCCECPVGLSGGECKKGNCPSGFKCMENGYCCTTCPNDATPYGACRNGVCGGSTMCFAGNICC